MTKSSGKPASSRHRKVWLYMVDGENVVDLEILDSKGFDTWKGHPDTKAGDLILMYRTAPYSDIASVFVAHGDARKVKNWYWPHQVEISDGYRLSRVIKRRDLSGVAGLEKWGFLRNARGHTNRKDDLQDQGVWHPLRLLIEQHAPGIAKHFGHAWTGRGRRPSVFLSYASPDREQADEIYQALSQAGTDVWLDRIDLDPAQKWREHIETTINKSSAFAVCVSKQWIRRKAHFAQEELKIALDIAKKRERFLFPVLIEDDCNLPDELAGYHAVRAHGPQRDARLRQLAADIRSLAHKREQT